MGEFRTSKVMEEEDYNNLAPELRKIDKILTQGVKWFPPQHRHRYWEYAMALRALNVTFPEQQGLIVSDIGCACCFISPAMVLDENKVLMYEVWQHQIINGINMRDFTLEQVNVAKRIAVRGDYELIDKPMGKLDREVDVAFCISTLEHIPNYQECFQNMLDTIKPGGMFFLTTDFADHETDDYQYSDLRAGKMFCLKTYDELADIAIKSKFKYQNGFSYFFNDKTKLVNDYGFACLTMIKEQ